jgi:hypothetical protein
MKQALEEELVRELEQAALLVQPTCDRVRRRKACNHSIPLALCFEAADDPTMCATISFTWLEVVDEEADRDTTLPYFVLLLHVIQPLLNTRKPTPQAPWEA